MLRRVKKYIRDHNLLSDGAKVLVCLSGGADSVALLDVLLRSGYQCIVAHCNFHLRGEESMRDEEFVRSIIPVLESKVHNPVAKLYVRSFDTQAYALEHKMSVELAARELRYQWFAELAQSEQCQAIAVAHHMNDQAETVLMHIRRGCGLKGLCGMRPISPNPVSGDIPVIRPFLCTTHDYICHYLKDIRHIPWVEDSTNTDTRFKRNAVRAELSLWSKAEIEHVAQLAERIQEVCVSTD